jgi:hypothetical protein
MFRRLIDLGCGDALHYPDALPRSEQYVGIDVEDHRSAATFDNEQATFVLGSAVPELQALNPAKGDLIVSLFSAHHIGHEELRSFLVECKERGAEFLIVDARLLDKDGFLKHYLKSIVAIFRALLRVRGFRRKNLRPFLIYQLRFLMSLVGLRHARADYRAGIQCHVPFGRDDDWLEHGELGALWWAAAGENIEPWITALGLKGCRLRDSG